MQKLFIFKNIKRTQRKVEIKNVEVNDLFRKKFKFECYETNENGEIQNERVLMYLNYFFRN